MCTFLMGSERECLPRKPFSAGWGQGALKWLSSHVWLGHCSSSGKALRVLVANPASEQALVRQACEHRAEEAIPEGANLSPHA